MKVIGVVGLPASGKGEFSRIAGSIGIPVVVMGDVIRQAVREAGLPVTDENLGNVATGLREKDGMAAIALRCIPVIESQHSPVVLVDGIRGDAEVDLFRTHFDHFLLIGVDAPFEVRLARLSVRGRGDDMSRPEELALRDRREIGWGLSRALEEADYTICNDETIEEFEARSREILEEILEDA
ncbi:MAG: flagellar hook-basal body complex protein FliE [Methanoregulaceae archaeon]|jgi:dephospho-CoA kinase|nr:flagellar hook-basal body complex protein FliE [Methanoregulaceae archaeon]MDD5048329.1 AAA family ATPase [Methanoregulaceae archaeon]MDD5684755.1 AAA family ATPase [Methanoregulaceae archaeon]